MKITVYLLVFANLLVAAWLYRNGDDFNARSDTRAQMLSGNEPLLLLSEQSPPAAQVLPPVMSVEAQSAEVYLPASSVAASSAQSISTPATEAVEDTSAPTPSHCHVVGPFTESKVAQTLADRVTATGAQAGLREESSDQPSGYWVYLSAMPQQQAQRIVEDFEAKGVKDYFLGKQNFISLGLFSDKRSADARVKSIAAMGYSPRLEPRFLKRTVFWVDVVEQGDAYLNAAAWVPLLADAAGVEAHVITCK